jgi:two-component system cell cycle response regulator DivK
VGVLVLIVDDERNAKLACDVLERAGMRTLVAVTAQQAIDLARRDRPDVVLMDLRLPDLDGTAAAERLAGDPATAAIPLVALSAIPAGDWRGHASFVGYIEKPIDVRALPGQVRSHCRR